MTTAALDQEQARNAVAALSVGLGALAVLAPRTTAGTLGVTDTGGSGALLVRMIGIRNATMGLRTMQATGHDQRTAVQAGLVIGVVDTVALLLAARKGVVTKKAAAGGLALLGAIAALGVLAARED